MKEEKVIKGKKLRMNTMVTEENTHYSTNTGLLADGIRLITRTVVKVNRVEAEIGSGFINNTLKIKGTCLGISKRPKKRTNKDNAELVEVKRQLVEIAKRMMASGQEVKTHIEGPGEKESPII